MTVTVNRREQFRAAAGAALGVLVAGLICRSLAQFTGVSPWLVAPIGASAVLVFALPSSPLAQPWPVIGGNTLSAMVGLAVGLLVPDAAWAGGLAVGCAILAMSFARCLHPPGGAVALLVVLTQTSSLRYPFFPVLADSIVLVLAGMAYNALTGRRYPHRVVPQPVPAAPMADAYGRKLDSLRCMDVMSRDLIVADVGTPLHEARELLHARHIKVLPVVDPARHIVGIVTVADFRRAEQGLHSGKSVVVGDIMSRQVSVASDHRPVTDLLPLFAEEGHHHIPIVDAERRLCGIITPSDLLRALYRSGQRP